MPENLQEQLSARIEKKEKVNASQVSDAYTQTIENRRKEYLDKGGSAEKFAQDEKAFLDGAKEQRNRQLELIGNLREEYEAKKLGAIIDKSKSAERDLAYQTSRSYGLDKTDPEGKDALVPDYEGTGDEDRYGFGRSTLSGYIMAMQFQSPSMADEGLRRAKESYETTSSLGDHYMSNDGVREIVGANYLSQLEGKNLTDVSKGFLAAYLRLADGYFTNADVKEAYKKYMFGAVDSSLASVQSTPETTKSTGSKTLTGAVAGLLTFGPIGAVAGAEIGAGSAPLSGSNETVESKNKRTTAQLDAFKAVLSPQEWDRTWKERLQSIFDPFKKTCDTMIEGNPDFHFQDPTVNEMLGKKITDLSYLDDAKIRAATVKAQQEVFAYLQTKKDTFGKEVEANKTTVDGLKTRNKTLRSPVVSDDDWKAVDENLQQQSDDLDAVAFVQNTSLEDLGGVWNRMAVIKNANGLIKAKLEDQEKQINEAAEKEAAVTKFVGDKKLTETYDEAGKKSSYAIGDALNNPEVQGSFGNNFEALKTLVAKKDPGDAEKKQLEIYNQALKDSVFTLDNRPTLEELQKAYDGKFSPVWEKAAKDFDALLHPPVAAPGPSGATGGSAGETPTSTVGGGFLGESGNLTRNGEVAPSSLDPYGDHWAQGVNVPIREDLKGVTGGLQVAPRIEGIKFRDVDTHRAVLDVPGGTGGGAREITLADPNADMVHVDDLNFVKVNYRGKVYYAASEFLEKNLATQQEEQRLKLQSGLPNAAPNGQNPEMQNVAGLEFLGKVNSEYSDALQRILRDSEKPGGALFDLSFNKKVMPCRLMKNAQNQYVVNWEGGALAYPNLAEAMRNINSGYLLMQITFGALLSKDYYEPYENSIDDFKEDIRPTGQPNEAYFELDWKGAGQGEGNAQVWVMAYPYGGIGYRIRRDHVGIGGENQRDGFAANFDDLMKQIGHIKTWSENYESNRDAKKIDSAAFNREVMLSQINDPRLFYAAENGIGRPVSFEIADNGVVQMYLDWGGGAAKDGTNALLNVSADANGQLNYTLNFGKKGLATTGTAKDLPDLLLQVGNLRSGALGQDVLTQQQITSMSHGLYDTPPPTGPAPEAITILNAVSGKPETVTVAGPSGPQQAPAAAPQAAPAVPSASPFLVTPGLTLAPAESQENVDKFLQSKYLVELTNGKQFMYFLFDPTNNPDTAPFWNKARGLMETLGKSLNLSPEDAKAVRSIMHNRGLEPDSAMNFQKTVERIEAKLSPETREKFVKFFSLVIGLIMDSRIEFTSRPTMDQLQTQYQQNMLPKWKNGEAQLDAIMSS